MTIMSNYINKQEVIEVMKNAKNYIEETKTHEKKHNKTTQNPDRRLTDPRERV